MMIFAYLMDSGGYTVINKDKKFNEHTKNREHNTSKLVKNLLIEVFTVHCYKKLN